MKKRALSLIAILGLGLSALVGAAPASAQPSENAMYVAFGDSEAAGTGNLPYVGPEDCMRSKKSFPLLLGGVSYACAGATSADVLAQVNTAALVDHTLGPGTMRVTISVGVNDVLFPIPGLPGPGNWQDFLFFCAQAGEFACSSVYDAKDVSGLAFLTAVVATIEPLVHPDAEIIVMGYPVLFGDVADSCSIGAYAGMPVKVSATQAAFANAAIRELNATIFFLAASGGTIVPVDLGDPDSPFADHALCSSGDRWISGLVSGKKTEDRSLHINAPGQKAIAALLAGI